MRNDNVNILILDLHLSERLYTHMPYFSVLFKGQKTDAGNRLTFPRRRKRNKESMITAEQVAKKLEYQMSDKPQGLD